MNSQETDKGWYIAKLLWPGLVLQPHRSLLDRYGLDAHLDGSPTQIKYDSRIVGSNNLYHEIYEKTANSPWQEWRKSPSLATIYIFTTESNSEYIGYKVKVDILANIERGRKLLAINPNNGGCTSMGFIIPLDEIKYDKRMQPKNGEPTDMPFNEVT